jgi:polyferredoxin
MGLLGMGRWILGLSVNDKPLFFLVLIISLGFVYYNQWLAALAVWGLFFIWTQLRQ